jgi:hypothetical protein
MPNLTPLITHRPDSKPLYANKTDAYINRNDGLFYTTFTRMGATGTYAAGTTTNINTKDLAGANKFVFSPLKTGVNAISFAMDTNAINWNGGVNSEVSLQMYDVTTSQYIGYPLYIYAGMPAGANGILVNGVSYLELDALHQYSFVLQILPVAQTVDFTASGTNRVLFTSFVVAPPP